MTTAVRAPAPASDPRRLTESDPDYVLLHRRTLRALLSSIRQCCREAAASQKAPVTMRLHLLEEALTRFRQRHLALMQAAYEDAHGEGQVDYWHSVSNQPGHTKLQPANTQKLQATMELYAPSVAKMAREIGRLAQAPRIGAQRATEAHQETVQLDEPTSVDDYAGSAGVQQRVALQAQVVWPGLNDGYIDAGSSDTASPFAQIWWNLEPMAQHCEDCPLFAAGSPYTAPGSGGNELQNTPGDGSSACGAACKCDLSYDAPADGPVLDALNQARADQWTEFLSGMPASPLPAITQGGIQPRGTVYTPLQRSYMDEMRQAQADWNEARGALPAAPDMFNPSAWNTARAPMTPWGTLTPYQQDILDRMSQINLDWLHAVGELNWPTPPYLNLEEDMRNWLQAAARGDFTPWWRDYQQPQAEDMMAWLKEVAESNRWPDPPPATDRPSMEEWLKDVARTMQWPPTVDYGMSYAEVIDSITLYNPNHDSHGRFTYGNGTATTRVERGKGTTRRTAGGKRVKNTGAHAALSKPGSTGAPGPHKAEEIIAPDNFKGIDEELGDPAAEVAGRLAGNKGFEVLAASRGYSREDMCAELEGQWGTSSNNPDMVALKYAVTDEFGLKGTTPEFPDGTKNVIFGDRSGARFTPHAQYEEHAAGYRAFVRAQYESTQDYLKSKGVSSLTLYRGSVYEGDPGKGGIRWGRSGEGNISTRALSSFTTSRDTADEFGVPFSGYTHGVIISADVPASRIFSFPATGFGADYQQEVLTLGGTDRWSYTSEVSTDNG